VTLQPDTYVRAWDEAARQSPEAEARVRRLGTLTRAPEQEVREPSTDPLETARARDVSWRAVRDLLDR
jgi:hypothetical protein